MSYQFKPSHFYGKYKDKHDSFTAEELYELVMNIAFRGGPGEGSIPGTIDASQIVGVLKPSQLRIGIGTHYDDPDFDPTSKETPEGAKNKANDALKAAKEYRDEWKEAGSNLVDSRMVHRKETTVQKPVIVSLDDGTFAAVSHATNLKTNIQNAEDLSSSILSLVPKKWVDSTTSKVQYGLLKEDLESLGLSDFVGDTTNLLVILLPLIKHLKERVEYLENMVNSN